MFRKNPRFDPLLSHKDEFPGRGLKRWRNVPAFLRIWDIASGRLRVFQVNLMLHPDTDLGFMGQPWVRPRIVLGSAAGHQGVAIYFSLLVFHLPAQAAQENQAEEVAGDAAGYVCHDIDDAVIVIGK